VKSRHLRSLFSPDVDPAPVNTKHHALMVERARMLQRVESGELSVAAACKEAGLSRARFYQLRALYSESGLEGLRPKFRAERPDKRFPAETEDAIVAYALLNPEHGERAIVRALANPELGGLHVSRHGVGEVLRRHGLSRQAARVASAEVMSTPADAPSEGEDASFELLYQRYRGLVYEACFRQLRDRAQAEDAMQETFIRVYSNLSRFDASKSLAPWVRTIASNVCIDTLRKLGRISVTDPENEMWSRRVSKDEPLETLVSAERRGRLARALEALPPRQRRALLLHSLEGWNYEDIASAERISTQAVKSLLFRARRNLRSAREAGLLGLAFAGFRSARRAAARHRVQPQALGSTLPQLGTLLLAVAVTIAPAPGLSLQHLDQITTTRAVEAGAFASGAGAAAGASVAGAQGVHGAQAGGEMVGVDDLANGMTGVTDSSSGVRDPEQTSITSIVFSPRFASDRSVYALGAVPCVAVCSPVLFKSSDAGTTWTRLQSAGLSATSILLPPGFPADPRIYAMGTRGLQVSTDGGAHFGTVLPAAPTFLGSAAISPLFDRGDPEVLIGAQALVAYKDDVHSFVPSPYTALPGPLEPAYSPRYAADGTLFVGGSEFDAYGKHGTVFRCDAAVCTSAPTGAGVPKIRFDSDFEKSGIVYAFSNGVLFRSRDSGRSFERIRTADGNGSIDDLAVLADGTLVLATHVPGERAGTLLRSADRGETWSYDASGLPALVIQAIARDERGRLIAGLARGVACSADGGRTWARRCAA
jgi:RNA polymerase sigma-70 factor (ECF subfamily)